MSLHKFLQYFFVFTSLLTVFILTSAASIKAAEARIDPGFYPVITNGDFTVVNASAIQPADGKIILAGSFSGANGFSQSGITRLLPDGRTDQGFGPIGVSNGSFSGIVYAIGIQPADGKIVVGGSFTNVGGQFRRSLARLNADGTLDTNFSFTFLSTSTTVLDMIVDPDGKIIIAGNILEGRGLLRLNADGSLDTTFTNALPTNVTEATSVLRQPDGKLVVAFRVFESSNWTTRIARLNSNGSLDATFTSSTILGTGATAGGSPDVDAMLLQPDGRIVVGGSLTSINGQPRARLARLDQTGALDPGFQPNVSGGGVFSLAPAASGFLAGGSFTQINGTQTNYFARLNSEGNVDTTLVSPFTDFFTNINTISVQPSDGKIIAGGQFLNAGGSFRYRAVRLNPNGSVDGGFAFVQLGAPALIAPLARRSDGKIFVTGNFANINGAERQKLALLNADGTLDTTFQNINFGSNFFANCLLPQPDGKILLGGTFTFFAGEKTYDGFVRFNQDGTLDTTFADRTAGASLVGAMAFQPGTNNGKIVIGGSFTTVGGVSRNRLARINASDGTLDETFLNNQTGANAFISGVTFQADGKVLVGGGFTQFNGATRRAMTRLNADGSLDTTFLSDATAGFSNNSNNAYVRQIIVQPDGKFLVRGNFDTVNGMPRKYLARLNADGSLDTTFLNNLSGTDGEVQDFVLRPNGKILIGGNFTTVNGQSQRGYAQLNPDGTLDTNFVLNFGTFPGGAYSFAIEPNGNILIGGSFRRVNNFARSGLFRVLNTATPFDYDGDGKADLSVFRPSVGSWYISNSSNNTFTATQFGANGDLIAPADFDGDGKTDISVFRPSDGSWYRINSSNNTFSPAQFGTNGDLPAPGDFDGDGKADLTVFRPSTGSWFRVNSSNNQFVAAQFGANGDKPLVADFDGDGKSDLAVYRPSDGGWYRINSATDTFSPARFGTAEDKPVPADYDGDGKADLAVYRPSAGDWYIIYSSTSSFSATHFGISEDKPSPGDFDGDGKADLVVWRPSNGTWYLLRTTAGFTGIQFGANGDIPTPNAFVR